MGNGISTIQAYAIAGGTESEPAHPSTAASLSATHPSALPAALTHWAGSISSRHFLYLPFGFVYI